MKNLGWLSLLLPLALATAARPASAQIFTPTFQAPVRDTDVGGYLSSGLGNDGFALEGIWRRGFGPYDLGLRAGVADADHAALLVGAEYRNPLELDTAPVELYVTGGAQAVVGEESGLGVQAGVSAGYTFPAPGLSVTPYFHPRLAVVDPLGRGDGASLELLADLGVDLAILPGLALRVGLGFGHGTSALGVGLAWH